MQTMENKLDKVSLYSCLSGRGHLELGLKPGIATTKATEPGQACSEAWSLQLRRGVCLERVGCE